MTQLVSALHLGQNNDGLSSIRPGRVEGEAHREPKTVLSVVIRSSVKIVWSITVLWSSVRYFMKLK